VDQAQQLHLRAALLNQVLVEQELLIGKQVVLKLQLLQQHLEKDIFVIQQVVLLKLIYQLVVQEQLFLYKIIIIHLIQIL